MDRMDGWMDAKVDARVDGCGQPMFELSGSAMTRQSMKTELCLHHGITQTRSYWRLPHVDFLAVGWRVPENYLGWHINCGSCCFGKTVVCPWQNRTFSPQPRFLHGQGVTDSKFCEDFLVNSWYLHEESRVSNQSTCPPFQSDPSCLANR